MAPHQETRHWVPARGTAARERDGLDVLIQLCWLSEFHQHDVIVDGVPVVLWMGDDDGRCDELPGAVLVPDVVLTQMQLNVLTPERREQRERDREMEEKHMQTVRTELQEVVRQQNVVFWSKSVPNIMH